MRNPAILGLQRCREDDVENQKDACHPAGVQTGGREGSENLPNISLVASERAVYCLSAGAWWVAKDVCKVAEKVSWQKSCSNAKFGKFVVNRCLAEVYVQLHKPHGGVLFIKAWSCNMAMGRRRIGALFRRHRLGRSPVG